MNRTLSFFLAALVLVSCQDKPGPLDVTEKAPAPQIANGPPGTNPWFWYDMRRAEGQAFGWVLGDGVLTIEYDDPITPQSPDWSGPNPSHSPGDANSFDLGGFWARGGDVITISGALESDPAGTRSKTLVVHDMLVGADFENEIAYGYAGLGWGDEVCMKVEQPYGVCEIYPCVSVGESRHWEIDLSGLVCENAPGGGAPVDLEPGLYLEPIQYDDDGEELNLNWISTTATSARCVGFGDPWASYPVIVQSQEPPPLTGKLYDARGVELTDANLTTPPIVRVMLDDGSGVVVDVTDWVMPAGSQSFYSAEGNWELDLDTSGFSSAGTYTLTMASGDEAEYLVYPYSTCKTQLAVEASGPQVTIVDLGFLPGGDLSHAWGINDRGEVVGMARTLPNGEHHAFLWTEKDGMVDLGTYPGHTFNWARDINNQGEVVGRGGVTEADSWNGWFRDKRGGMTLFEMPADWSWCTPRRINQKGEVVGTVYNEVGDNRAFLWTEGEGMRDVGSLGGPTSGAHDINQKGQVVGSARSLPRPSTYQAFLWTEKDGMVGLGTLPGVDPDAEYSRGLGINARGDVVGWSFSNGYRAFLWTEQGGMMDLGTLPGYGHAYATDINDRGDVVGSSWLAGGVGERAVLWPKGGGAVDLGTLGGDSSEALAINARGQIVGRSKDADGATHAVMWIVGGGKK